MHTLFGVFIGSCLEVLRVRARVRPRGFALGPHRWEFARPGRCTTAPLRPDAVLAAAQKKRAGPHMQPALFEFLYDRLIVTAIRQPAVRQCQMCGISRCRQNRIW